MVDEREKNRLKQNDSWRDKDTDGDTRRLGSYHDRGSSGVNFSECGIPYSYFDYKKGVNLTREPGARRRRPIMARRSKTRRVKTRQVKARREKTRRLKPRQGKTGQVKLNERKIDERRFDGRAR